MGRRIRSLHHVPLHNRQRGQVPYLLHHVDLEPIPGDGDAQRPEARTLILLHLHGESAAMNYRLNLDDWLARFPLEESHGSYSAEIITSPWHLSQNEHLRRELRGSFEWGRAVPMDVFVMAEGEPDE